MSYNKKIYIVRDSKDNFYEFYLNDGKLTLKNINIGQPIFKENVLEYAIDIDKDDKIHIVYFDKEGRLNYCIYFKEEFKEKNILSVSEKYTLRLLNIKVICSKLHIFYQVYNLNKGITAVYHNYLYEGEWIYENIAEPSCPQYVSSYCLDYYNNDIYFFYPKNYDLGKYSIKKFNTKENRWKDFENSIIIKGATNLNVFIAPNKILIVFFNKLINSNIQTMVIYKDLNVLNSLWSPEINISNNNTNTLKPTVFYKNNSIYIMWMQGDSIVYKKSSDMMNWSKEFVSNIKLQNKYNLVHLSNNSKELNFKINHVYTLYTEFLNSVLNFESDCSCDSLSSDNVSNNSLHGENINLNSSAKASMQIGFDKYTIYKDSYIQKLIREIESKNEKIVYINEANLKLKNQIDILNNLINEYESRSQNAKVEQIMSNKKHSEAIYKYENEIKNLEEEKNKSFMDMSKKIESLLKIIEEKDNIIQKLYEVAREKG